VVANGGEIEFGKWYNVYEYQEDESDPTANPTLKPRA
jgi:hypothetical protein